jgi:hypothetical protein
LVGVDVLGLGFLEFDIMTKLVLVEEISTFLMRYVVELNDDDPNFYAEDTVCMNQDDTTEFSQKHVGTSILSSRELSKEEYIKLFDADNEYLSMWTEEQKLARINKPT